MDASNDVILISTSNFIPISLLTSFQFVKYFQGYLLELSPEFKSTEYSLKCQTSQLNEDLGLIDYVFTDKTGTLTKNSMVFRSLFINNMRYGTIGMLGSNDEKTPKRIPRKTLDPKTTIIGDDPELNRQPEYVKKLTSELRTNELKNKIIFDIINCCHDVIVKTDSNTKEKEYNASSPDELALLVFAEAVGLPYEGLDDHTMEIMVSNTIHATEDRFKRLVMFRFTSDRSRMTVIVRDMQTNEIYFFMKGADQVVIDRCTVYSGFTKVELREALTNYSSVGLRTLVYAYKRLSEDDLTVILTTVEDIEKNGGIDKARRVSI